MFKKKAKDAPAKTEAADEAAEPKKRSKLKLAIFVAVPLLLLAGGGYGAWAFFLAPAPEPVADAEHGVDPQKVAALKAAAEAETSATYTLALAELLRPMCGQVDTPALAAAAEAEAAHDGRLVSASWMAAARRLGTVTDKSCGRLRGEIQQAETLAGGKISGGKGGKEKKSGGH